jgi:polyhydroxybutyrate depolymerase
MISRRKPAAWLAACALLLGCPTDVSAQTPGARSSPQPPCPDEGGCAVEGGAYRIVLPPGLAPGRRVAAIMYFHGYQASAAQTIADPALLALARRMGVALIAPDGLGRSWSFPGSPARARDEFAYVAQVLDDVARRFPVDRGRIMASGFSQGGSMVWSLACRMPERFAAFAPIAGAFWEPLPERCTGPRPALIHVHGTADTTVPLAGRTVRPGARQGDVFRSFAVLNGGRCAVAGVADRQIGLPDAPVCAPAAACGGMRRLELCLHDGGHVADAAWLERAWRLTMVASRSSDAAGATLTFP